MHPVFVAPSTQSFLPCFQFKKNINVLKFFLLSNDKFNNSSLQECPSGIVDEETFKFIYAQFFPQGGESFVSWHTVNI